MQGGFQLFCRSGLSDDAAEMISIAIAMQPSAVAGYPAISIQVRYKTAAAPADVVLNLMVKRVDDTDGSMTNVCLNCTARPPLRIRPAPVDLLSLAPPAERFLNCYLYPAGSAARTAARGCVQVHSEVVPITTPAGVATMVVSMVGWTPAMTAGETLVFRVRDMRSVSTSRLDPTHRRATR